MEANKPDGMAYCKICKKTKPADDFTPIKTGGFSMCQQCWDRLKTG